MKILIIGSGGREHALTWKLQQSPRVTQIICLPGNGGTPEIRRESHFSVSDLIKLRDFAVEEKVDLTVVGPDDALANGIVDIFQAAGLKIFGPTQAAAKLEASKIFAKEFMQRHGIPTARSGQFSDPAAAQEFARTLGCPLVIKADGLALGKGVVIASTHWEAALAIYRMMERRQFGDSGASVVIEELLTGPECSIHALIDGSSYLLFPGAQDHKRAYDGDRGPNTGGMGTCSPVPVLDDALLERVKVEVLDRFMAGIRADGLDFRGMLFPGLMLTPDGPKVLEFNARFGDPETQVLLARLQSDLLDLIEATIEGRLSEVQAQWDPRAAVCVVLASGGYPGAYEKGRVIEGIENAEATGAIVFHAGTRRSADSLETTGGRVLGVTALGKTVNEARRAAYAAVEKIHFSGAFYRSDIGARSIG